MIEFTCITPSTLPLSLHLQANDVAWGQDHHLYRFVTTQDKLRKAGLHVFGSKLCRDSVPLPYDKLLEALPSVVF